MKPNQPPERGQALGGKRPKAAAMGFPAEYEFKGNREQRVKQIGNAVPCGVAKALCESIIGEVA